MRTVATLSPQFWIGETGRELRPKPNASGKERERFKDARIVATYLTNAPSSTMYGLYYVTARTIAEETGLFEDEVRAALALLHELDYARYDPKTEFVWVMQMAWHQLGCPLKPGDRRVTNVNNWYRSLPKNPWLGPFFDRYREACHLEERREGAVTRAVSMPLLRDVEGAGSPFDGAKDLRPLPVQEPEGVQGEPPKPAPEPEDGLQAWFNEFHALYPANRRVGGQRGQNAFREAIRRATAADKALTPRQAYLTMRRALQAHKSSEQWQQPRLVPSMSRWLSEDRWNQSLEQAATPRKAPAAPVTGVLAELIARMEVKVNRHTYYTWFRPLTAGPENGSSLTVVAPNDTFENWILNHYGKELRTACEEIGRPELKLKFVVASEGA